MNLKEKIKSCLGNKKIFIDAGHPVVIDPSKALDLKNGIALELVVGQYNSLNPDEQIS